MQCEEIDDLNHNTRMKETETATRQQHADGKREAPSGGAVSVQSSVGAALQRSLDVLQQALRGVTSTEDLSSAVSMCRLALALPDESEVVARSAEPGHLQNHAKLPACQRLPEELLQEIFAFVVEREWWEDAPISDGSDGMEEGEGLFRIGSGRRDMWEWRRWKDLLDLRLVCRVYAESAVCFAVLLFFLT
ncbi:hypothetical protein HK101_008989 [Irineochytrium annulatum]|nr:hypothetical protein HK101_008989 [Irineochytrium annulatum]